MPATYPRLQPHRYHRSCRLHRDSMPSPILVISTRVPLRLADVYVGALRQQHAESRCHSIYVGSSPLPDIISAPPKAGQGARGSQQLTDARNRRKQGTVYQTSPTLLSGRAIAAISDSGYYQGLPTRLSSSSASVAVKVAHEEYDLIRLARESFNRPSQGLAMPAWRRSKCTHSLAKANMALFLIGSFIFLPLIAVFETVAAS